MGTLYLVRHGQAAFGTDDYDRLTETGFAQARLLGAAFAERGIVFAATYTGTLRRHRETLEGIVAGLSDAGAPAPGAPEQCASLDEYNPDALVEAFLGRKLELEGDARERHPERMRAHFRLLRDALVAWAEARTEPVGMPSFAKFQAGALEVLDGARLRHPDANVLIVSSGGPISALVCATLEAPPRVAVELNLRVRNCSVTEFATNPKRQHLLAFNSVAHLERAPDPGMITFA
jgi:broad specificity phosphatase PhoE